MVADPTSPIVAADTQRDDLSLIESPHECLALVTAIADGARHRLAKLAAVVGGGPSASSIERVVTALDAFRQAGMALAFDADAVSAHPFIALESGALERSAPGWRVHLMGSTSSTNTDLSNAVRREAAFATPRLVTTEFQIAGRGRLGRRWSAVPGASLTASFALPIERPLAQIDGVTLVCGLALREVVAAHRVTAELKWPNDLVCRGRKLGGILVEAHATDTGTALVVGIGLNVGKRESIAFDGNNLPSTDLAQCDGHELDRNRIVGEIAAALLTRLALFAREGFVPFVEEWNRADALRDRHVALHAATGDRSAGPRLGIARGVDARGALLVDVDGALTRVISGDVSVRAIDR
jgi:BirA family transcriptional regulator, biotin operon repressor / biotin---[acetyl-CoA-carboxylase] ligase